MIKNKQPIVTPAFPITILFARAIHTRSFMLYPINLGVVFMLYIL